MVHSVFSVSDEVTTVKSGGTMITEPREIPGVGRYAAFRDPSGNEFGALQYD